MATKESHSSPPFEIVKLRRIAYLISISFIFILPWRALLTVTEGFTLARIIGALAGLFWIVYLILQGKARQPDFFHVILFLFVAWTGLSLFWSINKTESAIVFFTLFSSAMFCFVLWDLFRTETDIMIASLAYIFGCYVVIFVEVYYLIMLDSVRIGSIVAGPNYIIARLVFGLPLAWYLVVRSPSTGWKKIQYIGKIYFLLASITILLTHSRQGLIALTASLLILVLMYVHLKRDIQVNFIGKISGVLLALAIAIYSISGRFQDLLLFDRLEQGSRALSGDASLEDADLDVRLDIYSTAIEIFYSNFWFGTGAGTFPTASELLLGVPRTPHSTYLAISTETGIVGLVLFVSMILVLLKGLININSPRQIMGITLLFQYLLISLVNTWFTNFIALFVLTMILLSSRRHTETLDGGGTGP